MSWAKFAIGALRRGESVQIRPRGHSMRGKVNNGDLWRRTPDPVPPDRNDEKLRLRFEQPLHGLEGQIVGLWHGPQLAARTNLKIADRSRKARDAVSGFEF